MLRLCLLVRNGLLLTRDGHFHTLPSLAGGVPAWTITNGAFFLVSGVLV
jgi:hypothetical protein